MELIIRLKVRELLNKQNMTQSRLSEISGVPPATLSDIVNDKRSSVNKVHLVRIAEALRVKNINELIDFEQKRGTKGVI